MAIAMIVEGHIVLELFYEGIKYLKLATNSTLLNRIILVYP